MLYVLLMESYGHFNNIFLGRDLMQLLVVLCFLGVRALTLTDFYFLKKWPDTDPPAKSKFISFVDEDSKIVVVHEDTIELWSVVSYQLQKQTRLHSRITALESTGDLIWVATNQSSILTLNIALETIHQSEYPVQGGYALDLQVLGGGKLAVVGTSGEGGPDIYIYTVSSSQASLQTVVQTHFNPGTYISKVTIDQNQHMALYASSFSQIPYESNTIGQQLPVIIIDPQLYDNDTVPFPLQEEVIIYDTNNWSATNAFSIGPQGPQIQSIAFSQFVPNQLFVFLWGGIYIHQITETSSNATASLNLNFTTYCLQEEQVIYLGFEDGRMLQWDIEQEQIVEDKQWKFGSSEVLSIVISYDGNYMVVATATSLFLLTRSSHSYLHSWLMGGLTLLILLAVLLILYFASRKGKILVAETNKIKKQKFAYRRPSVALISSDQSLEPAKAS